MNVIIDKDFTVCTNIHANWKTENKEINGNYSGSATKRYHINHDNSVES